MQVGKVNNTSFGINVVRFANWEATDAYHRIFLNGNNSSKKIDKTFEKIHNLKPKTGPDVDILITKCRNAENSPEIAISCLNSFNKPVISEIVGPKGNTRDTVYTMSIKELYKACKRAVKYIDELRK